MSEKSEKAMLEKEGGVEKFLKTRWQIVRASGGDPGPYVEFLPVLAMYTVDENGKPLQFHQNMRYVEETGTLENLPSTPEDPHRERCIVHWARADGNQSIFAKRIATQDEQFATQPLLPGEEGDGTGVWGAEPGGG